MKILFIETPSPYLVRQHAQVPLGLLYLATVVNQSGHDVKFIRPTKIEEVEKDLDFDIVCLSATTLEYPMTCKLAQFIKASNSRIKVFLGGTHVSVINEDWIEFELFDAICKGEGEELILEMINDVKRNRLKQVYQNYHFIEKLDGIPFPDRDLIPGNHGGSIFLDIETGNENIITSRGCYFNCAFCASESIWHRKVRFRSTANIIAEIKYIIDKYGTRVFRIADENITSNEAKCLDLCNELKKLDVMWRCSVRAESITPKTAKALVEAGCREISVGIESGDQEVLNYLRKNTTLERMLKGCQNARDAGLKIRCLFMIGTPGESKDTPERNKEYLMKLAWDGITLATFIPLPGTDIWNNPEQYNCTILTTDFSEYNKDYYVSKDGKATKREYKPLIHNRFLSVIEQSDNVKRMEKYIEETNKYNRG